METKKLLNSSGFFISAITAISLSYMLFSYLHSDLISLFPFSFILVLYTAGIYLRSRRWRNTERRETYPIFRYSYILIPIMAAFFLIVFFYFGARQITTYALSHYSFNFYILLMAAIWTVYSSIEIVMSKKEIPLGKFLYVYIFSVVFTDLSILLIGYQPVLLPISLLVIAVSSFSLGAKAYRMDYGLPSNSKRRFGLGMQ